ncbi:hypothetical protein [Parasutterella muris]|uniref:Uncharacterized protein n=1 Tax=Parasutterella muris TaxID=2565572 RepID=A0A6L6YFB5_9BURK|nr:hypothetical protein [Parasutterella muris]MVX56207.1 hypothetical protein [Parasutterella muris]
MLLSSLSAVLLSGCSTPEPYVTYAYEPNAQNARSVKRLQAEDVAVAEVRVAKAMDLDCAGTIFPIPGEEKYKNLNDAFAAYWKNAFMADLKNGGALNQDKPKVKIYNLIDSVKIQAEPTMLAWRINMEIFSSNGSSMKAAVVYNVPTDSLKNMQDGCRRLAAGLDKAVRWSILEITSDPRFQNLVQPGLDFVPSMKAASIQSVFLGEDEEERWSKTNKIK